MIERSFEFECQGGCHVSAVVGKAIIPGALSLDHVILSACSAETS